MTLKIATLNDVEDCFRLAKDFFNASPFSSLIEFDSEVTLETIRNVLQADKEASIALLSINKENVPTGFLAASTGTLPFSTAKIAYEVVWWVDPAARTSKAGLELKKAFEYWASNIAKAQIINMALLEDMDASETLKKFYVRSGYKKIEEAYYKVRKE